MARAVIFLAGLCALTACKSHRATSPPVILTNSDSVKVVRVVETSVVDVDVDVPLPQQSQQSVTACDTSQVETDLAISQAWVAPDGLLHHTIANKSGTLPAKVSVPQTTATETRTEQSIQQVPVPQPYPVEVERKLTLTEQIKLRAFWPLLLLLPIAGGILYRQFFHR